MGEMIQLNSIPGSGDSGSSPKPNLINLGARASNSVAGNPVTSAANTTGGGANSGTSNSGPTSLSDAGLTGFNIFNKAPEKEKDSKIMNTVIAQKEATLNMKPILGPAPTLEKTIEIEKDLRLKKKFHMSQIALVAVFVIGAGLSFYFYSQLSPNFDLFGANVTRRLTDTNVSLRQLNTDILASQYLAAQLNLNELSYQADSFFTLADTLTDANVSADAKAAAQTRITELTTSMPTLLGNVRKTLTQNIVFPTTKTEAEPETTPEVEQDKAELNLRLILGEQKKKIPVNSTTPEDILQGKLIDNAVKLVGNDALANTLQQTSVDKFSKDLQDAVQSGDAQKLKDLQNLVNKILITTKSDLATVASVKRSRNEWSSIIQQIETETMNVDKNYGQRALYESLGGIIYTDYEFDAATNKILLSGMIKTADGSNFKIMSNLIDQLESSQYFQNVEMRSYIKAREGETGSTGFVQNFKVDLRLENLDKPATNNAPIALDDEESSESAGVKRKAVSVKTTAPVTPAAPADAATIESIKDLGTSISAALLLAPEPNNQ